jgi:hypothetical protein
MTPKRESRHGRVAAGVRIVGDRDEVFGAIALASP